MELSQEKTKPTIYYDKNFAKHHDPKFGNLECGARLEITDLIIKYVDKHSYRLVEISDSDSDLPYNLINSFNPIIGKLFSTLDNTSIFARNCHACTSHTKNLTCEICHTRYQPYRCYYYAFTADPTIVDSDTTFITPTTHLAVVKTVNLMNQMIEDVVNRKTRCCFAFVRPPGHHATLHQSSGFCIVNNVAIAAKHALNMGIKRVFIFDFDAHHGNGTQKIFYDDSQVYYCSIHTLEAYPFTGFEGELGRGAGLGYNRNFVVKRGITSQEYLQVVTNSVLPLMREYQPEIIIVSSGFDGLASDPMAIMNLDPVSYVKIIRELKSLDIPLCFVLEGGYDIEGLHKCFDLCLGELDK